MASIVRTRPMSFQPMCTFLYPQSCFIPNQTPAKALISTARLHTHPHKSSATNSDVRYQLSFHCRQFTTTSRALRINSPSMPKLSGGPPKSYRVRVKEELGKNGLPDDIGLFENTLIMPTGKSKPGIFSQPRLRAALEWYRLKARALDFARLIIYKFSFGKPRPKLHLLRTAAIAKRLHAKTFKAFAEGDMATLNSICTSSVRQYFARQIAARPANTKYVWTIHRYLGRPRVVSQKAAILTQLETSTGQRQAVIKIRSLQSLTKVAAGQSVNEQSGSTAKGAEDQQQKCEYFVIQQRYSEGVGPGEWQVWGTLSEKGWEEILERAGYTLDVNPVIADVPRK